MNYLQELYTSISKEMLHNFLSSLLLFNVLPALDQKQFFRKYYLYQLIMYYTAKITLWLCILHTRDIPWVYSALFGATASVAEGNRTVNVMNMYITWFAGESRWLLFNPSEYFTVMPWPKYVAFMIISALY